MATNWRKAQENEAQFWRSIYVENRKDVPTYMPITDDAALEFSKKTLERFGHGLDTIVGRVVIDVGCGPYGLIRGFQVHATKTGEKPERLYGVDPLMDTYLKFGTLPVEPYIEYVKAKAESIPLADGSCDLVLSTNVIDHVEDPDSVLKECQRVCRSDGEVCFAVHVVNFPFTLLRPILFLIDKNHPHHFNERFLLRMARRQFRDVAIAQKVTILEDHPEFKFMSVFSSKEKIRGLKRWLSTFLLSTRYLRCRK